ncbi:MAG: DUF5060 domain-containing protein [Proteiniphilum sp.]
MKRNIIITSILLLISYVMQAQIGNVTQLTDKITQYDRSDFQIELKGKWTNPYLQEEVTLDMLVTTPSGKNLVVPCYYESGESGKVSIWKARFTPRESGQYEYQFELKGKSVKKNVSKKLTFTSNKSDLNGFLNTESNWILRFDNGEPFRGVAENICWESRTNDDSKFFKELHERGDIFNYDSMIPKFAKNGGNFVRVWMCSWNFPIDRKNNFNNSRYEPSEEYFNRSVVDRLDHFVELCEKENVYVMLCMGQGDVSADHNFFINDEAKKRYKNRLRYIVAKWGYSPNIAMWEFFNEIDNIQFRNAGSPIPPEAIVAWHDEMSTYLKLIDPYNHIVTTSISHRDIEGLNSVKNIDINQKHIYNNTNILPSEIVKYVNEFKKPYIIGEFGREWDWSKNFDDFSDEMDIDFKRGLWYGIFSPTPVTPMSWWWEYFEVRGLTPYFRGVREINDRMLAAGKGEFEPLTVSAGEMHAYSVKCGDEVYVYVYNPKNSTNIIDVVINLPEVKGKYKGESFEPTMRVYNEVKYMDVADGKITLNKELLGSNCELVYIISKQ